MRVRHYLYISKGKVGLYLPQVRKTQGQTKTRAELKVGPVGGQVERVVEPITGLVADLEKLIDSLRTKNLIGTLDDPKEFLALEGTVRPLVAGGYVLFGGQAATATQQATIVLTCSIEHMLGNAIGGQSLWDPRRDSGELKAKIHHESSTNIAFSRTLHRLVNAEYDFQASQYDATADLTRRRARYQLTDEEAAAIARRRWVNRFLGFIYPSGLERVISARLIKPFVFPFLWLFLGAGRHVKAKAAALERARRLAKIDLDNELAQERLELVASIRPAARHLDAPPVPFEGVVLRLVDEVINDERVILASPLYLARRL
ncbi:SAVMC3_10250 family protein [Saccharothrix luteola]|uniref:SAVMC3_10250 family protein n=1 Tax=Saccharothrix luteola TaxID=2893018 RepID=UPI001E61569B|nr:SAVMC3_10250 family protein [Saccharothrix luteola]MCC8247660.1 hypothetical protein [Saccharothrix luteola]